MILASTKALEMINSIKTSALLSLLILLSSQLSAANFLSELNAQQAQQIFDRADKSNSHSFVHNASSKTIPIVQILPQVENAQSVIKAGASCIKLYGCNQGICLLEYNKKKFAASEATIRSLTVDSQDNQQCLNPNIAAATSAKNSDTTSPQPTAKPKITNTALKFSWVKVINVASNDALNIRQKANYKTKKMGSAAFDASCIKRFRCKGKWCEINSKGTTGWVHRKFLQKLTPEQSATCS